MTSRWILFATFFTAVFAFAGEATNKPKNINQTGCECTVVACCVCVGETHSKALKVTLKGAGTDLAKAKVVLTKCDKDLTPVPVGQDGPRFDGPNGPNISKDLECKDPPVTEEFTINGGVKEGEYKVFIWYEKKDGTKGCEECGTICVFGLPNPAPKPQDVSITFDFKRTEAPNPVTPDQQDAILLKAAGLTYKGPGCAPAAKTQFVRIPREDGSVTNFSVIQGQLEDGTWRNTGDFVWTPPDSPAPGGGNGKKLGELKDECENRIEYWCLPSQFRLYFIDCHGDYYLIGACIFPKAYNKILVNYTTACNKKRFRTIELENQKAPERTPVNHFVFNACSYILKASKKNRDGQGNLPETPGETIEGFPLEGAAQSVARPTNP